MSGFSFGNIKADQTKKDLEVPTLSSPVMYNKGSGIVPFITGEVVPAPFNKLFPQIENWILEVFETYLDPAMDGYPAGFKLLSGLRTKHATIYKPLDKDIVNTYWRNSWDFSKLKEHMYDECPFVFTTGRGLYSVTRSDDLQTRFFYDTTFNLSYFYSPDLQKFVFPIDHFSSLLRKVVTNLHAKGQFDAQIISKTVIGSDPKVVVADVYQTNFALHQLMYAFENWSNLQSQLEKMKSMPKLQQHWVKTSDEAANVLSTSKRRVALDLETSGFDMMRDEIGCLTASYDGINGYYIPWEAIKRSDKALQALHDNFTTKNVIGANMKFDLKFLRRDLRNDKRDWGPRKVRVHDDIIQSGHVLNEARLNSLKTQSWLYTPYGGYDRPLEEYKRTHPSVKNYLDIPDEILYKYAADDASVTFNVMKEHEKQYNSVVAAVDEEDKKQNKMLADMSMYKYYKEIMMPVTNMFADVEYNGIYVNTDVLNAKGDFIKEKLKGLEKEIRADLEEEYGGPLPRFDLTSPTQLGKILQEIGWPCIHRSKSGVYATNDDALQKWEHMGYKVAKKIQDYRSWSVGLKTFVGDAKEHTGWWANIRKHPEDNSHRMHPNFAPMRAESGRNTCRSPNLQNIPAHGELAKVVKSPLAPPDKDFYIGAVDFDSFQLKIAAVHSKDPTLYAEYSNPKGHSDIHSLTAHKIFGERLFEIEEIEFEDSKGKTYTVFADQYITVKRNGKTFSTIARDYEYQEMDQVILD